MEKKFKHADICKELNDLYIIKNADYGDSFGKSYERYGEVMAAIRLNDKLNRFERLIQHKSEVKDESVRDTLIDLANYAIMTIVEMDLKTDKRKTEAKMQRTTAEHIACAETFFNS